jgi:hypothetical protein
VLFGLGQTFDTWKWSFAGVTGSSDSGSLNDQPAGDRETILDAILGWTPNESFSAYINADWIQTKISRFPNPAPPPNNLPADTDVEGFGVAVAGRYAFTEATGFALRGEYVDLDEFFGDGTDLSLWTLTGTLDHKLADQLTFRVEARMDKAVSSSPTDEVFNDSSADLSEDDQVLAGVEVIYSF